MKIIILDDSADDAALICRTLRKSLLSIELLVVSTREEFEVELPKFLPDIILSDHQIPQFSSNEALEIARNLFPLVPFILVTGAVSEEFAASIIKAGADDYILKGNLARLPMAISQALSKYETNKSFQTIQTHLTSLFNYTDTAYLLLDLSLRIQYFNSITAELISLELGTKFSEGDSIYNIIRPERHEFVNRVFSKVLNGESINYDHEFTPGKNRWYHFRIGPIRKENGQVTGVIIGITDISKRKRAEQELLSMHQELSDLIEYANTPILGTDKCGCINEWNKVTEGLTGHKKQEVLGKELLEYLVAEMDREKLDSMLKNVLCGELVNSQEIPIRTRTQEKLILSVNANPRRNAARQIVGALMVGQDITELINYRRNLEVMVEQRTNQLNTSLQKEKELIDLKSRFVSLASHEFRTPLSTIIFAAESLRSHIHYMNTEEIDAKLMRIENQAEHMTNLLNDILTVSKSESNKIKVLRTDVHLRELVANLIDEVRGITKLKCGVTLAFERNDQPVSLDDKLFRNILVNLLTNAIKFSAADSNVEVTVGGSSDHIMVEIGDHGLGIAPDEIESIFEPFNRGSNVSHIQGTGLGLSIMKRAVGLLEGNFEVQSTPNVGTNFKVKIPLK